MAIGFELETAIRVEAAGIDYRTVVFSDARADGGEYFHITLDTDDRGELVLEFDLAHSSDATFLARMFRRVELLRAVIAAATRDMTTRAALDAAVTAYEKALHAEGFSDDVGRAAGIKEQVDVVPDAMGMKAMGFARRRRWASRSPASWPSWTRSHRTTVC